MAATTRRFHLATREDIGIMQVHYKTPLICEILRKRAVLRPTTIRLISGV